MIPRTCLWLFALTITSQCPAQAPGICTGQQGNASLAFGPQVIGLPMTTTFTTTPSVPFSLYVDLTPGDFTLPFGRVCLGLTPALFAAIDGIGGLFPPMPATGNLTLSFPLPPNTNLTGVLAYAQMITLDGTAPQGVGISDPASIQFTLPDWYLGVQNTMSNFGKGLHAAATYGNGRFVALTGGGTGTLISPTPEATVEIYDHYTRTFLPGAPLSRPRVLHTATTLPNGKILVTGGLDGAAVFNWDDGEVYDPATNTWTPVTNTLQNPRAGHTAVLLNDGRVWIAGGNRQFAVTGVGNYIVIFSSGNLTTDFYDPATNAFTPGPNLLDVRFGHEAVKLADGRVLLAGGINGAINLIVTALPTYNGSGEIFNPVTQSLSPTLPHAVGKLKPSVALLPSGNVLVAGGAFGTLLSASNSSEIWNVTTGGWTGGPIAPQAFALAGSAVLAGGSVAILGGGGGALANFTAIDQVVRFTESLGTFSLLSPLPAARINLSTNTLPDGSVLIAGGSSSLGVTANNGWLWNP